MKKPIGLTIQELVNQKLDLTLMLNSLLAVSDESQGKNRLVKEFEKSIVEVNAKLSAWQTLLPNKLS